MGTQSTWGSHHRLHVQGLQAKGSEEKREMEAELRTDLNSRDAPFHEALRLLRVSQGHTALRRVEAARRILRHGILGGRGGPNNVTKRTGVPAACLFLGW